MNFLAAIGAFLVAFILINIVLPAQTAALIAVVVGVLVFFGYPRRTL